MREIVWHAIMHGERRLRAPLDIALSPSAPPRARQRLIQINAASHDALYLRHTLREL